MTQIDELRLVVRVARMYYEWDIKQSAIAKQLGLVAANSLAAAATGQG